ncbi:hypothetical protein GUITHDRAFT_111192 [Guillardia theta CCMP2712]|nr:hypothetical protein GUITHDRAFT_111192 [Guillardia theta CCMP2712]EKX42822.1 hypothetical protein GUITHDRAFT_111192 [Guillardia theta CCMP2712]|eukprot:XP_005829802.1 hypothetical protein GUITHDRAFT_111192 [Guillardia theta CCMP2712]
MSESDNSNASAPSFSERVIVAPRSRPDGIDGPPIEVSIDLQVLEPLYCMRQEEAAERLGVCLTSLKSACRKLGVMRWPYKKGGPSSARYNQDVTREGGSETASSIGESQGEAGVEDSPGPCARTCIDSRWLRWYMSATDDESVIYP